MKKINKFALVSTLITAFFIGGFLLKENAKAVPVYGPGTQIIERMDILQFRDDKIIQAEEPTTGSYSDMMFFNIVDYNTTMLQYTGASSTTEPMLTINSSDSNHDFQIVAKGTGIISLQNNTEVIGNEFYLMSNDSGSNGPAMMIYQNSESPATDDESKLTFNFNDDNGNQEEFVNIYGILKDSTDSNEDGQLTISIMENGLNEDYITFNASEEEISMDRPLVAPEVTVDDAFFMQESSTPSAVSGFGALYTKSDNFLYFQNGDGTEQVVNFSNSNYGEMYIVDNSTASVINDADEWHAVTTILLEGLIEGFIFQDGLDGIVASIADAGGGYITVSDVSHGLSAGEVITMNGLTDPVYDGLFIVSTTPTADTFLIEAVYTATDTGYWQRGASLTCNIAGTYKGGWTASGISQTNAHIFDFAPAVNTTISGKAKARRKFSNADYGSFSGGGLMNFSVGDRITFNVQNVGNSGDVTIRTLDLNIHSL